MGSLLSGRGEAAVKLMEATPSSSYVPVLTVCLSCSDSQTCTGTAWPSEFSWVGTVGPAQGTPAAQWKRWPCVACRRHRTGRTPLPSSRAVGCRRSCTGRSRSGWWWCGWCSPPRWQSAAAAVSCTSRSWGTSSRWPRGPPGWRPAPPCSAAASALSGCCCCLCTGREWHLQGGFSWCPSLEPVLPSGKRTRQISKSSCKGNTGHC